MSVEREAEPRKCQRVNGIIRPQPSKLPPTQTCQTLQEKSSRCVSFFLCLMAEKRVHPTRLMGPVPIDCSLLKSRLGKSNVGMKAIQKGQQLERKGMGVLSGVGCLIKFPMCEINASMSLIISFPFLFSYLPCGCPRNRTKAQQSLGTKNRAKGSLQ